MKSYKLDCLCGSSSDITVYEILETPRDKIMLKIPDFSASPSDTLEPKREESRIQSRYKCQDLPQSLFDQVKIFRIMGGTFTKEKPL